MVALEKSLLISDNLFSFILVSKHGRTLEEKQAILACGAGASTKRVWNLPDGYHIERCENVKDIKQYIARIDEMIERKKALFEKD